MPGTLFCLLLLTSPPVEGAQPPDAAVMEAVMLGSAAFLSATTISLAWASAFSFTQLGNLPLGAVAAAAAGCTWLISVALFTMAPRFATASVITPTTPWDPRRSRQRTLGFLILLMGPVTAAAAFFSMIAYGVLSILAPVAGLGRPLSVVTAPAGLGCCALQGFALCLLPVPVVATTVAGAHLLESAEDG